MFNESHTKVPLKQAFAVSMCPRKAIQTFCHHAWRVGSLLVRKESVVNEVIGDVAKSLLVSLFQFHCI